jgi:hypothetical protein
MRPLPAVNEARGGVFSYAEALNAGWTPEAVENAVRMGRIDRLRPGIFRAPRPDLDDAFDVARDAHLALAIGAALANPGAVLSHASAAVAHDLPVWRLPGEPCLTVPPGFTGEIVGTHLHRATTPASHYAMHGVPVHDVPRTVIDMGREHGPLAALVTADAALHLDKTTIGEMQQRLRDCRGWPGVRAAREAIQLADRRAESPLETASRFKLLDRVPAPELQPSIFDENGRFLGRSDFLWDDLAVVGEADGMAKFDKLLVRPSDEYKRQSLFERAGLVVVRWTADDLSDLDSLVVRLRDAYAKARRLNLPRRWSARLTPRCPPSALHL